MSVRPPTRATIGPGREGATRLLCGTSEAGADGPACGVGRVGPMGVRPEAALRPRGLMSEGTEAAPGAPAPAAPHPAAPAPRTPGSAAPANLLAVVRTPGYLRILLVAAVIGAPISALAYGFVVLFEHLQVWLFESLPKTADSPSPPGGGRCR